MKQIEMRRQFRRLDRTSHTEAGIEQRPIETLAIEGNQHRAFAQPLGNLMQHGMLFVMVAHEELLDLNSASVPPCQPN